MGKIMRIAKKMGLVVLLCFLVVTIVAGRHKKAVRSASLALTSLEHSIKKGRLAKFLLREPSAEQWVLALSGGTVVGDGGIVTPEGKLLEDTIPILPEWFDKKKYHSESSKYPTFFDGRLVVLSSPFQYQWYHWLLQVLPRLKILVESGIVYDKIYINDLKFPWQKQTLAIALEKLQIPWDKLLLVEGDDSSVKAKTLIVPSMPYSIFKADKKTLPEFLKQFLQETFLCDSARSCSKKIYISRSKAAVRRIINENALIELLISRGFEILHLEELSVQDQAGYFHNAELIIGPHGSGFTNVVFCRPSTTLIEIDYRMEGYTGRLCFKDLARDMKCNHLQFIVDLPAEASVSDDFYVDTVRFQSFLDNAIQSDGNKMLNQKNSYKR